MFFFQPPYIAERIGKDKKASGLSRFLQQAKQTPEAADRDARAMAEPGRLTAINWYRAIPFSDICELRQKIIVALDRTLEAKIRAFVAPRFGTFRPRV